MRCQSILGFHRELKEVTKGYRGLQGVVGNRACYKGLQEVTWVRKGYRGLQGVTKAYRGFQEVTTSYRG